MNNLGTGEILIVAIVLFILFGGKKLPELAKGLGEAGREFNKALKGIQTPPNPEKKDDNKNTQEKKSTSERG